MNAIPLKAIPLYKMRYSIEPKERIYVKGYGFMSFARSMSNKYGKKLVDTATKSAADAIKTASKTAIQKTAEATGDLVGNKIADKITSVSKKSTKKLPTIDEDAELTTPPKKIHITRRKTTNWYFYQ